MWSRDVAVVHVAPHISGVLSDEFVQLRVSKYESPPEARMSKDKNDGADFSLALNRRKTLSFLKKAYSHRQR